MKLITLFTILLLNVAQIYGQTKTNTLQSAVGSTYSKIEELKAFKGYKEMSAALLTPIESNYAIVLVENRANKVLVLDTCLKDGEKIKYKILDVVVLGRIPANLCVITVDCRVNREFDSNIIAIVNPKKDDEEFFKKVVKAFRINRATRKIRSVGIKGIDCINDGYGL